MCGVELERKRGVSFHSRPESELCAVPVTAAAAAVASAKNRRSGGKDDEKKSVAGDRVSYWQVRYDTGRSRWGCVRRVRTKWALRQSRKGGILNLPCCVRPSSTAACAVAPAAGQ